MDWFRETYLARAALNAAPAVPSPAAAEAMDELDQSIDATYRAADALRALVRAGPVLDVERLKELAADAVRSAAQVGMFFPALELMLGIEEGLTQRIAEVTARLTREDRSPE